MDKYIFSIGSGSVAFMIMKLYQTAEQVSFGKGVTILMSLLIAGAVFCICEALLNMRGRMEADSSMRVYEDEHGQPTIEFVGEPLNRKSQEDMS